MKIKAAKKVLCMYMQAYVHDHICIVAVLHRVRTDLLILQAQQVHYVRMTTVT